MPELHPTFSVVVPTHSRPHQLDRCLEALSRQDYPRDRFEVIVVDDGSADPPFEVVTRWSDSLRLTLYAQANSGPASARNAGAARASGEFLAFTDDDCAPAPDWLRSLAAVLVLDPAAMVGGHTVNALRWNVYSEASQALVTFLYDWYNAKPGRATFFTSNNFAMRAAAYRELGGFDTTFRRAAAEDREFCDRWLQRGFPMVYAPEARVEHFHALNLRSYWRQHFNYGCGAYSFHRRRADRHSKPLRVEPPRFYSALLAAAFGRTSWLYAAPVTALLGVSQMANALGFFWERARSRRTGGSPTAGLPLRGASSSLKR